MPGAASRPSARQLLGGRWAISLRGWLILSALQLAAGLPGLKAQLGLSPHPAVIITLASWLAMTLLYAGAGATVFRNRRVEPLHAAWLVALGVIVGIARASIAFAVPESRAVVGDSWAGMLTLTLCFVPPTVLSGVLVTYLIAVVDWYATERMRLLRFEIAAEAARLRAVGALNAARAVITRRIQTALEDQLGDLERAAQVEDGDARLSDALLDAAAGYVRPESHRLWREHDPDLRRGSLVAIEHTSLGAPLPIALPWTVYAAIVVPGAVTRVGFLPSLVSPLALLLAMAVLYPLGRAAIRRHAPAPRYMRARLIALATMAATAVATFAVVMTLESSPGPLLQRVLLAIVIVVTTIVVSWAQAALRTEDARMRSMRSHAEAAEFDRLALEAATEQMQRELALHLHGTVQAGLVASAYSLQDAVNRGDAVALETAIADARFAISRVGEHDQGVAAGDLATLARQSDGRWRGLVDITWELPGEPVGAEAVHRIGGVVQECLANASIHGAATRATVRIAAEDHQRLIVEITDNGSGLGDGAPGLGSAVLNESTGGDWTIASLPTGGTRVRAAVPV